MRGAATKSMSDIVEERQQSRYAPFAAAPLRAAARRPARFSCNSWPVFPVVHMRGVQAAVLRLKPELQTGSRYRPPNEK